MDDMYPPQMLHKAHMSAYLHDENNLYVRILLCSCRRFYGL